MPLAEPQPFRKSEPILPTPTDHIHYKVKIKPKALHQYQGYAWVSNKHGKKKKLAPKIFVVSPDVKSAEKYLNMELDHYKVALFSAGFKITQELIDADLYASKKTGVSDLMLGTGEPVYPGKIVMVDDTTKYIPDAIYQYYSVCHKDKAILIHGLTGDFPYAEMHEWGKKGYLVVGPWKELLNPGMRKAYWNGLKIMSKEMWEGLPGPKPKIIHLDHATQFYLVEAP